MLRVRAAVVAGLFLGGGRRTFAHLSSENLAVAKGDSIGGSGLVLSSNGSGKIDSAVVWLHGLGDTAEGWLEPMAMLAAEHPRTRFILPTAPSRPVTLNNGYVMPAWMDIAGLPTAQASPENEPPVDEAGLDESARRVLDIVRKQVQEGVPRERVVLGGFSQGGAVALHASMAYEVQDERTKERHAPAVAAIACSTWLPLSGKYPAKFKQTSKHVRVLQCHGDEDPVVRRDWGLYTVAKLKDLLAHPVEYKEYPMQHSACLEEIQDISKFLDQILRSS